MQSDNDLLKKASAFFAMEMNNDKSRGETEEGRRKYPAGMLLLIAHAQRVLWP
ncbi:hypothetical protein [Yersinia intermedia]|uniref:hypothetical protein n=1 Tax=Yersinia intermedia TaxID=631 RepID=UPI000B2E4B1C|nr:hypothetical protein [Yersinia intermedia]